MPKNQAQLLSTISISLLTTIIIIPKVKILLIPFLIATTHDHDESFMIIRS